MCSTSIRDCSPCHGHDRQRIDARGNLTSHHDVRWTSMQPMTTDASLSVPTATWTAPEPLVQPMPERTAAKAVLLAVAAGILAQLLFVDQLLGINFPIWISVVLVAAWFLRPRTADFDRLDAWLPLAAVTFAVFVGLRDDDMLLAFDLLAACLLTLASVVAFGGHALTRGPWLRVVVLAGKSILVYFIGAVYVVPGVKPLMGAVSSRRTGRWGPVLRGLAIAIPLLIVFAALFAAADAIFQAQLRNLVNIDWIGPEAVGRAVIAGIAGWLFAGTMACAWIGHTRALASDAPAAVETGRLGTTEALIVLIALDVMFLVFAALQAVYLISGLDTFAVSGMSYSDYARRGFFELIIAAFLAGVVIVVIDRLVGERSLAYRLAAGALAVLTGVVVLSAFVRLGLYQAAYGWTELRFYALAAITWLALAVVATLVAVLAKRARWLPQLVVGAGLLVALVCNFVGPQAYVTDQNLQRAIHPELVAAGGETGLDVGYLRTLGSDAVPDLIAARSQLSRADQAALTAILQGHANEMRRDTVAGWPSWNLARQRGLNVLVGAGY